MMNLIPKIYRATYFTCATRTPIYLYQKCHRARPIRFIEDRGVVDDMQECAEHGYMDFNGWYYEGTGFRVRLISATPTKKQRALPACYITLMQNYMDTCAMARISCRAIIPKRQLPRPLVSSKSLCLPRPMACITVSLLLPAKICYPNVLLLQKVYNATAKCWYLK